MTGSRPRNRVVPLLAAIFAGAIILLGAWLHFATESPKPTDLAPEVSCDPTGCDIRITALVADRQIRSAPLPFRALTAEIESISGHALFGHVLPGRAPRALTAWSIGREDHSVGVAVDVVDTGVGGHAVLVYQFAGFDHVKRAHLVLIADDESLAAIAERIEGAGPQSIGMAPVEGGIRMTRTDPDGTVTAETFLWRREEPGPALVPSE